MAEGIRVHHTVARSCVLVLMDRRRPYPEPFVCPKCVTVHTWKAYHIDLDDEGTAIVSTTIWANLQAIPGSGFALANVVLRPPDQTMVVPSIVGRQMQVLAPSSGRPIVMKELL